MAEIEISVVPMGTRSPSVGVYVAECIKVLKKDRVHYSLNSMGTVIEGELDDLLKIVKKMHSAPFRRGVQRVVTSIKIDDRRDKKLSGKSKVNSVRRYLDEK